MRSSPPPSISAEATRQPPLFRHAFLFWLPLLLAATAVRLFQLGSQSLWFDELFTVWVARHPLPDLLAQVAGDGETPPLYYLVMAFWHTLGLDGNAWPARVPSLVAGVLLVPATALLAQAVVPGRDGMRVGRIAATLVAFSPLLISYSQELRTYTLASLFVLLSFGLALRLQRRVRESEAVGWPQWALYTLVSTAALYSHYYSVFGIAVESLLWLWLLASRRSWTAAIGLGTRAVAAMLFALWFLPNLSPAASTVFNSAYLSPGVLFGSIGTDLSKAIFWLVFGKLTGPPATAIATPAGGALSLLLCVVAVALAAMAWRRHRDWRPGLNALVLLCAASLAGPVLASAFIGDASISPRYIVPAVAPCLILLSAGVLWAWERVNRRAISVAVVLLVLAISIFGTAQYFTRPEFAHADWKGLLRDIQPQMQPGDAIFGFPFHHIAVAEDYYAPDLVARTGGGWEDTRIVPVGTRWGGYAELYSQTPDSDISARFARMVVPYHRLWIVIDTDQSYDETQSPILTWLNGHATLLRRSTYRTGSDIRLFLYQR